MGSRSSRATGGKAVPLLEVHLVETVEATWSQQTPESGHIGWCWNKVFKGEAWCQMYVVIFHDPRKAAATLSRELFLGRAGTWLQSQDTGNSRVQQAFLGAADIWPHCSVRLSRRGAEGVKAAVLQK